MGDRDFTFYLKNKCLRTEFYHNVTEKQAASNGCVTKVEFEGGSGSSGNRASNYTNYILGAILTTEEEFQTAVDGGICVPGEPTGLIAEIDGLTDVIVSLTAPSRSGGVPITGYRVASVPAGGEETGSGTEYTFSGLSWGTYQFHARAVNSVGESVWSALSNAVYVPGAPAAPTGLVASSVGSAAVTIGFVAADDRGAAITRYEYSIRGDAWVDAGVAVGPVVVSGLNPGTSYSIRLRAVNGVGAGDASAALGVTTVAVVPSAPTDLNAVNVDETSVTIGFTAGANGGSAILNYKYSIDGGAWVAFSPVDVASPVVVGGLTAGVTYSIRLLAVNGVGDGAASAVLSVTTTGGGATAPVAPIINFTLADDSSGYVYFISGGDGGSDITSYEYSVDSGEYVTAEYLSSPILINGLTNGQTYTIKMRAVNAIGTSLASNGATITPVVPSSASPWLHFDPSVSGSYPGSGSTVTNIGSYGALSGTITGGVTYNSGVKGGVFDFNGVNGSVISFPTFDFGSGISVCAWVYPRLKANINGLIANTTANTFPTGFKLQWNWWLNDSRVIGMQAGNGTLGKDDYSVQNTIVYNEWQHIAYVFDNSGRKVMFFRNGFPVAVLTDCKPLTGINMNAAFNIGGYIGGSYTMNAQLGYIKVYSSLLDATQVRADYNASSSRFA